MTRGAQQPATDSFVHIHLYQASRPGTFCFCCGGEGEVFFLGEKGVCVFYPIYSGRQTCGHTSRGHTGFLNLPSAVLGLIFLARRIKPSLSLIDRKVEFSVPTKKSFSTCWA